MKRKKLTWRLTYFLQGIEDAIQGCMMLQLFNPRLPDHVVQSLPLEQRR